jgi:hypothetical protein
MRDTSFWSSGLNFLIALVATLAVTAIALAETFPVQHDLVLTLDPESQRLSGVDSLKLGAFEDRNLLIRLAPDARIISVSLANKAVSFSFKNGQLNIPRSNKAGEGKIELIVSYKAFFRDPVPVNPVNTEDPSYGVTGVVSSQGTFLLSGAGWYPHVVDSVPTFRVRVEAPEGYEAVTAGRRLSRKTEGGRTTSVWELKHGERGLSLVAGRYVVREAKVQETPVYTYFFPEDDHLSENYLKATVNYLRMYTDLFGPYPFEKYAVVENFFPTGYGFPCYTVLGRMVIRLPFIIETSLGHEVAHAWWGNGVLVDYEKGNWSEGLTSYVADYLYEERSSPEEGRAYRLKILRDYATLVPREEDFPLKSFVSRVNTATRAIGYGKAAIVFHMARRLIGDGAFWESLRQVFKEKLFERASWDDFAEAMTRISGRDLTSFFEQWISRPGAPDLALEVQEAKWGGKAWEISGQVIQKAPFYDLNVPVRLETQGENIDMNVLLTSRAVPVTFRTERRPGRLVVDPEADLFRRLDPSEVPPAVNGIKGSTSLVVVASHSLSKEILEASRTILDALGQGKAPVFVEDGANAEHFHGHDVLYLGLPGGNALQSLPSGVAVAPDCFQVHGLTYDTPDDALFLVLSRPQDTGRLIGLFLPLSEKAASTAVRKISHYGKYSYLVFRKGVNKDKGTWPVTSSPLIHVFSFKEVSS